jgi:hypothetical protein
MTADQLEKLLNVERRIKVVKLIEANHHDHKVHKKSPMTRKSNA